MINDIRYALRMLTKNPALAGVVVLTLALGIGANAAIFSLLDQVLLQSLPVANPDQLVVLSVYDTKAPEIDSSFSYPMYQDLRDRNAAFSGVIARGGTQMNVIPKTGGNTFAGTGFLSTAGEWSQGSNIDAELEAFRITNPNATSSCGCGTSFAL